MFTLKTQTFEVKYKSEIQQSPMVLSIGSTSFRSKVKQNFVTLPFVTPGDGSCSGGGGGGGDGGDKGGSSKGGSKGGGSGGEGGRFRTLTLKTNLKTLWCRRLAMTVTGCSTGSPRYVPEV
ncbi:hypothetical protein M0802_007452 [Mischocyttarus mexicanus]|nr:hypothetical protein M0802_007452 [Mischocyttarus mexicanus]